MTGHILHIQLRKRLRAAKTPWGLQMMKALVGAAYMSFPSSQTAQRSAMNAAVCLVCGAANGQGLPATEQAGTVKSSCPLPRTNEFLDRPQGANAAGYSFARIWVEPDRVLLALT